MADAGDEHSGLKAFLSGSDGDRIASGSSPADLGADAKDRLHIHGLAEAVEVLRQNLDRHTRRTRYGWITNRLMVARNIVIAGGVLAALIIAPLVMLREAYRQTLTVVAFDVPQSVAQRGITGEVVAKHLFDEMILRRRAISSFDTGELKSATSARRNDIASSDGAFSLQALFRYLRTLTGREITVDGEMLLDGDNVTLVARVPGNPPRVARGKLADWERLMGGLANYVFETTQPVVLAAFMGENTRTPQDIAALSQLVQRMVETEPRIPETELAVAYHAYGEALQRQRRTDEALLAWERARAYDPKLVLPYWSAANVLFGSDPQAADALFRQAQTLPSNSTDRLGAYLQRFYIASNKRDCTTMASVLASAEQIAADRKFSTVIVRMSAVHMQNCEYQQARAVNLLQNLANLHSEVATYWINVATAQARRDRWRESHQAQLRVLAADPNKRNPFVRMNLAVTSAVLGELQQAEAYYRAGLEMQSADSSLARSVLGTIRFYQGDYGAAEQLQRLVVADKSSVGADDFGDLAKTIARQDRVDEAIKVLRQGIAHTPQFCPNYDVAASILLRAGRDAEAFAQWDAGIALMPKCDINYLHYAQAQHARSNPAAARALLEALLRHAPLSDAAVEARPLLAAIGPPK